MALDQQQVVGFIRTLYHFSNLADPQLRLVADQFLGGAYVKGQVIYSQNTLAQKDYLYLIQEGKVLLKMEREGKMIDLTLLGPGDFFGYEMLADGRFRLSTAVAQGDVKVLKLDRSHTGVLVEKIPSLAATLKMFYETNTLRHQVQLTWCEKDEIVYYMARRHPINLAGRLGWVTLFALISNLVLLSFTTYNPSLSLIPFVILLLDWVFILIWAGWNVLDWMNDYSIITNRRVMFQENIIFLYESRREAPLNAILSTTTQTDLLARIFKYGDVVVRTYAGSIFLPMLLFSDKVRVLIDQLCTATKKVQAQMERKSMEDTIRQKIGLAPPGMPANAAPAEEVTRPGRMNNLLSLLEKWFNLRYEKNGALIFHTHWIILLYKIILPTLSLLGLFILFILALIGQLQTMSLTVAMAVLTGVGLVVLAWWLYEFWDWRNDVYIITQDQVVDVYKRPLAEEVRDAAPLKNINSVEFARLGVLGLFLNFGTVTILVGEKRLTFDNVYNPSEVQREIFKRMVDREMKEKQGAVEAERQRVAEWLSAYHRVVESDRRTRNIPHS